MRFLPELRDSHGSQVLLPFVKTSEKKRKAKAADDARAAMLSKSMDQSVTQQDGQSGLDGAQKRPPSATAQALLDRERAHNSRPHSSKTLNEDALAVKQKLSVEQELAKKEGTLRPLSREGVRPSSRDASSLRPSSRASDTPGLDRDAAALPPSHAGTARPASRAAGESTAQGAAKAKAKEAKGLSPVRGVKGAGKADRGGETKGGRGKGGRAERGS